ncbi:uncharacterized protein GGS22DRAFT_200091 [Annulohypoxylon maeteangense]|uniref:uncharacterized protein n=1 Tax=Annulohypoxylon maeteangense TaxID=1927788 RepID=UPI002007F435|nr:uncharacterized protein GGS22DRAFT_200091 [Annulohypoxylon maeteangense]KAI0885001.1 hypothetical protein GGS22DRAFT_200091 [Annulohypoxylon maeteangense]
MINWSPFAMVASPAILFIYSGLTLYVALCIMLGFKVAYSYVSRDEWCCYRWCILPKWALFIMMAVPLSIIFAIIIVPVLFCMFMWVFVIDKIRQMCVRRRKRRRGGNDVESGNGGANDDAASWITIETPVPGAPRDNQHTPIPQTEERATTPFPERPAPVHIQGGI